MFSLSMKEIILIAFVCVVAKYYLAAVTVVCNYFKSTHFGKFSRDRGGVDKNNKLDTVSIWM